MSTDPSQPVIPDPSMTPNPQGKSDSGGKYPDGRRKGFTYGAGSGYEPEPLPGEPSVRRSTPGPCYGDNCDHVSHAPLGDIPERYLVFFEDWWHAPLPKQLNLSPDLTQFMIQGGIHDLCRLAFKAGYEKGRDSVPWALVEEQEI